jgi:glutaredoxin 3
MADIEIYTGMMCGYCTRAKSLLADKGAAFREIPVSFDPSAREQMIERAGGRTSVPQVFIGETHVGGWDDLSALEREGKLDALLIG